MTAAEAAFTLQEPRRYMNSPTKNVASYRRSMPAEIRSTADDLWAITSYFNPARYGRRLSNFKIFREHLKVPLVVVELSYGLDFELGETDADILVRLHGSAVLWQKERLLNLALQKLPVDCRKVAWLDSDILFDSPDWGASASALLDRFSLIQAFKNVHYLPEQWTQDQADTDGAEFIRPSATFSIASGSPAAACLGHPLNTREGTSA